MQSLEYFKNHFVLNHQNYLGDRPKNGIFLNMFYNSRKYW